MTTAARTAALVAVVAVVAVLVYANTLGHGFAMDDHYNVVDNPRIRSLANLPDLFTHAWGAGAEGYAAAINTAYWRPLTEATYALDYAAHGLWAPGYHLVNVLLHAAVSVLVFLVAVRLLTTTLPRALHERAPGGLSARARGADRERAPAGDPARPAGGAGRSVVGAGFAGLLFAVHPIHTEAVNLVTYRTEVLATLFIVAMVWIHLRRPRGADLWLVALYALGLMSKETAVTAPGWLLLADLVRGRRVAVRTYLPLALVLGGYFAIRSALLTPSDVRFFGDLEGPIVAASVLKIVLAYMRLMVVPWPLTPFYDWTILPPASSLLDPEALAGGVALLALVALAGACWRRAPAVSIGLGWWLVGLLPFLHLVPLPVGAAERFLYAPSVGLCLVAGAGVRGLASRRLALVATGALLLVYGATTLVRNPDWASDRALFQAAAEDFPHSFHAHYSLGTLHARAGERARAEARFARAEEIVPAMVPNVAARAENLARAGHRGEALRIVDEAIARRGPLPALIELRSRL